MSLSGRRSRQNVPAMDGVKAADLLAVPVRLRGIQLGRPVDLILDPDRRRVLGFDVRCGDDERRFLPLAATKVDERQLTIASPLVLLEEAQLAFYTDRGSTFAALHGSDVARGDDVVGTLEDLELAPDGTISTVVVATGTGSRRVAYGDDVQIGAFRRRVRAAS